LILWPCSLR